MDTTRSQKAHNKHLAISFSLPSTPHGRKLSRPSASGSQHASYRPQPRIVLTSPEKLEHLRMAGSDREVEEYDSDDVFDNDEEAGLNNEDRKKRAQQKRRSVRLDQRIAQDVLGADAEKNLAYRQLAKESVINLVLIIAWYGFSIGISVFNKYVLSPDKLGFSFPLFFTSFHMIMQFVLAGLVMYFIPSLRPRGADSPSDYQHVAQSNSEAVEEPQPKKPVMTKMFYLTRISPCGAATGLDIGLGNMSLKYIKLTFYTMCKSSVLGFVLLFAFLFRLEKPSWKLAAIILTMAAGVVMMVAGEAAFNALGFILIMAASFFSGFRWSLTQILLVRNPATSNPFASIFFLAPVMFITLVIIAFPVEGPGKFAEGVGKLVEATGVMRAIGVLLFPGLLAFLMTASEFALLQRTSVVTLSVCGIFKEVLTITAASIIFGDELTAINISGLIVTIACIATYNYMKFTTMKEEAKKDAQEEVQRRNSTSVASPARTTSPSFSRDSARISTSSLIRSSLVSSSGDLEDLRKSAASPAVASPAKRPEDLE